MAHGQIGVVRVLHDRASSSQGQDLFLRGGCSSGSQLEGHLHVEWICQGQLVKAHDLKVRSSKKGKSGWKECINLHFEKAFLGPNDTDSRHK